MSVNYQQMFLSLDWDKTISFTPEYPYQYGIMLLERRAKEPNSDKKAMLGMLEKACKLRLNHYQSSNAPYALETNSRADISTTFEQHELAFFEFVIEHVEDRWLKARLADVLWLWSKKNKNSLQWVRTAIDCLTYDDIIHPKQWCSGQEASWGRAIKLSLQIKDYERCQSVTKRILQGIFVDYGEHKFMVLWLSRLLFTVRCCSSEYERIADRLMDKATYYTGIKEYHASRGYLELCSQIYNYTEKKEHHLKCLAMYAETYEKEGDISSTHSAISAKSKYEKALQAFREIPNNSRYLFSGNEAISRLKHKISESGIKMQDQMSTVGVTVDLTHEAQGAEKHVANKKNLDTSLLYFTGVYTCENYKDMLTCSTKRLEASFIQKMIGTNVISRKGRKIAEIPSVGDVRNDSEHSKAIQAQMIHDHLITIGFSVDAFILPALREILKEYRISREFLESLCFHSQLVPIGREKTLGFGLWLGFEEEFSAAVHLLCPQFENIVREQLKLVGVHTTVIDKFGVEEEIGLSSLVDKPEFEELFGKTTAFEIRTLFTERVGANLRNEVAHGLIDDKDGDNNYSVYAWWVVFKLIYHAAISIK
ncbi:DUF4209 domain-containing protein [Vibrio parahaemolyticus]|nr:DUF4209 domain-containing protein [Vibrio parahaemolyticus]